MAYAVLPVLLFMLLFEACGMALALVLESIRTAGSVSVMAFIANHEGDITALLNAAAMAAAFGLVFTFTQRKSLYGEELFSFSARGRAQNRRKYPDLYFSWTIRSSRDRTASFAVGSILLSLFLNAVLSASGAVGADPGAEAASEQTAAVSLPLGLLIYGLLTPLCEETIFRGITLNRVYRVLQRSGAGAPEQTEVDNPSELAHADNPPAQINAEDPVKTGGWDDAGGQAQQHKQDDAGSRAEQHKRDDAGSRAEQHERTISLAAILITSALFGLYHGNIIQGFYAFCMGTLFGFFIRMTGSLPAVILLHGAVNAVTLLISGSNLYNEFCTMPAWLAALAAAGAMCLYYAARRKTGVSRT